MIQYRYILISLLLAGTTCAQAQTPIVKINPGASECDVTAKAGDPIFQLDATGNVIVTGMMSGSCGTGGGGGTTTPTFGFNPPASNVIINGGTTSVAAGSATTVPFTYQAYNAASCSVAQPTAGAGCPAITASNGSCTGTGGQLSCAPTGATLSIPASVSATCSYSVTASCINGGSPVTSTATLSVTTSGGGGGTFGTTPTACTGTGTVNQLGLNWQRTTSWTWLPGQGTTNGIDATDYRNVYSPPGTGQQPWPSAPSGSKPTVTISANSFLALGFTVPAGIATNTGVRYFNVNSGSQPVSVTVSECPGDFGQAGTHITSQYCKSNRTGTTGGGVQTWIPSSLGTCPLTAGKTYYLNFIDSDLPASGGTTAPTTACTGGVCSAQVEMTSNQ